MKKIKTVFFVDYEIGKITRTLNKGLEWIFDEKNQDNVVATIKKDGTSVMFKDGVLYKRYDLKPKKIKNKVFDYRKQNGMDKYFIEDFKEPPIGSIPCQETFDKITGHFPHWIKVLETNPEDIHHLNALKKYGVQEDGTYELIGKFIGDNKHKLDDIQFFKHGELLADLPKPYTFESIYHWVLNNDEEGIVFRDLKTGEMAKIRKKDFINTNKVDDRISWILLKKDDYLTLDEI